LFRTRSRLFLERALSLVALLSKQGITVRELKKLFTLFKPIGDKRVSLTLTRVTRALVLIGG
jgi:hypothetical protein